MTGRRDRRGKQLLVDFKKTRGCRKVKKETLAFNLWRTRFGRGYGTLVRQTEE